MAGRPRKSSKQRALEGNPGKRPIPVEPDVPKLDGSCPEWLPRDGQALWGKFIPELRAWIYASKLDEPMLAFMAGAYGFAMQASRKLKREGLVRDGKKNPAAQIWKDNVALFSAMASKFGMTPADRARLFANEKPKEDLPVTDTLDGNWNEATPQRLN